MAAVDWSDDSVDERNEMNPNELTPTQRVEHASFIVDVFYPERICVRKQFALILASELERAQKERDQHAEQATLNATKWQECETKLKKLSGEFNGMSLSLSLERDDLKRQVQRLTAELEEYRSIAEKIGAGKAVSERDKLRAENEDLKRQVEELTSRVNSEVESALKQLQQNNQLLAENAELKQMLVRQIAKGNQK